MDGWSYSIKNSNLKAWINLIYFMVGSSFITPDLFSLSWFRILSYCNITSKINCRESLKIHKVIRLLSHNSITQFRSLLLISYFTGCDGRSGLKFHSMKPAILFIWNRKGWIFCSSYDKQQNYQRAKLYWNRKFSFFWNVFEFLPL